MVQIPLTVNPLKESTTLINPIETNSKPLIENAVLEPSSDTIAETGESASLDDSDLSDHYFVDKVPSNWVISALDESDNIVAFSNQTRETFEGPIKIFNRLLRGWDGNN